MTKISIFWFFLTLVAIAALAGLGPAEKSLGVNVRVVYLHGAWVWTALLAFTAAAVTGLLGLVFRRTTLQLWSRALGRTGLIFWITYLPISMWAMKTNWNGLFLAEPRFRLAVLFAIGGLVLQVGVTIAGQLTWAAFANIAYAAVLWVSLLNTPEVMHPASPIMTSESWRIQVFFISLLGLTFLLAWQLARWWVTRDKLKARQPAIAEA